MGRIIELNHPLVAHHLASLRDKATPPHAFREQIRRLSLLIAHEATARLPLRPVEIETPLAQTMAAHSTAVWGLYRYSGQDSACRPLFST